MIKGKKGGWTQRDMSSIYGGEEGEIFVSLLLFCRCNMRPGHLLRSEKRGRPVVDTCAEDFEMREVNNDRHF